MLNKVCLVGRLTREVETYENKETKELSVVNFALAFSQGKNQDGSDNTGFVDCVAYSNLAKTIAEWLSKGDKVAIGGRIEHRSFSRKDGSKGTQIRIVVDSLEFIDVLKSRTDEDLHEDELPFEPHEEVKVPEKPVAKPTRSRR